MSNRSLPFGVGELRFIINQAKPQKQEVLEIPFSMLIHLLAPLVTRKLMATGMSKADAWRLQYAVPFVLTEPLAQALKEAIKETALDFKEVQ